MYLDLLHELVARYAFPDAVEWAQKIEARTQMHKNVSEVVALEVHRLVSVVNVMRLALKAAGRTEILMMMMMMLCLFKEFSKES